MNFRSPSIWKMCLYLLMGFAIRLSAQESDQVRSSIHFPVNQSLVIFDFLNNGEDFSAIHAGLIDVLRGKSHPVDSIVVVGYSSPEGTYSRNKVLAAERAEKVEHYLRSLLPDVPVKLRSIPEDWDGLAELVGQKNFKQAKRVAEICRADMSSQAKKQKLRALPGKSYRLLVKEYLPALRRAEVWITLDKQEKVTVSEELSGREVVEAAKYTSVATDTLGTVAESAGDAGRGLSCQTNLEKRPVVLMSVGRGNYYARMHRRALQQRALNVRYNRSGTTARGNVGPLTVRDGESKGSQKALGLLALN